MYTSKSTMLDNTYVCRTRISHSGNFTVNTILMVDMLTLCIRFCHASYKNDDSYIVDDAVEAHSCVDIAAKFTDEQYPSINCRTF